MSRARAIPIVEVTWIDSAFVRGWGDADEQIDTMKIATCYTAGYMVSKDKDSVKIVMNIDPHNHNIANGIAIPMTAVKKIRKLL